jgi:hypothetical protein
MAVTKRTRYEVLRRDGHACRYCGGAAPDVVLTVDHVTPVALGGSDKPENLVAACKDCNAGKSSSSPDETLVEQVSDDAIRWSRALREAAEGGMTAFTERDEYRRRFIQAWAHWDKPCDHLDGGWYGTVSRWCELGLPFELLNEAIDIAWSNLRVKISGVFPYMCGIAWARLREILAAAQVATTPEPKPQRDPWVQGFRDGYDAGVIEGREGARWWAEDAAVHFALWDNIPAPLKSVAA